jgi:hypothetical protein
MKTLTLRLPDDEYLLINAEAEKRLTSITSLLRLYIRTLQPTTQTSANSQHPHQPQPGQPVPDELKLKPFDSVLNNEAMLRRYEEGFKVSQVAEHAGLPPQEVQARLVKASKARTNGALAEAKRVAAMKEAFLQDNPHPPGPDYDLVSSKDIDGKVYQFEWWPRTTGSKPKTPEEQEADYLAMERDVLEKLGIKPAPSTS